MSEESKAKVERQLPYGLEGRFHEFCGGCPEIELVAKDNSLYAHDVRMVACTVLTCEHYERCESMARRIQGKEARAEAEPNPDKLRVCNCADARAEGLFACGFHDCPEHAKHWR